MKRRSMVVETAQRVSLVYGAVLLAMALSFTLYVCVYMKD